MSKKDLMKQFPSVPEHLKATKKLIDEIVDEMLLIQGHKEVIAVAKEDAAEKYGVDPSWLERQAKIFYDRKYNSDSSNTKALEKAEEIETNKVMLEG